MDLQHVYFGLWNERKRKEREGGQIEEGEKRKRATLSSLFFFLPPFPLFFRLVLSSFSHCRTKRETWNKSRARILKIIQWWKLRDKREGKPPSLNIIMTLCQSLISHKYSITLVLYLVFCQIFDALDNYICLIFKFYSNPALSFVFSLLISQDNETLLHPTWVKSWIYCNTVNKSLQIRTITVWDQPRKGR